MTDTPLNTKGLFCWHLGTADSTAECESIYARPFGLNTDDLDIAFSAEPRPVLLTRLLGKCLCSLEGQPFPEDELWGWNLTRRLQGLLAVVVATEGQSTRLSVQCPRVPCREQMELELDLTAFRHHEDEHGFTCTPEHDIYLQVRLPTGNDQMNWLGSTSRDSDELAVHMATTMVTRINDSPPEKDWLMPESWLQYMEPAFEKRDPFTAMTLDAECPHCDHTVPFDINLEDHLIHTLSAVQRSRMNDIHRLASVYHWSEEKILSLPLKRRQYYLRRILEGGRP
jgi:hypothetical protein